MGRTMIHALPQWRTVLKRSHAIRVQLVQALLGVLTFIDPGVALGVWNMMPESVSRRVPPMFVSAVGAILFGLALLTIVLRLFSQPRLTAKIEEKTNGPA